MLEAERSLASVQLSFFLDLYFLFEILNDKQCDKMYYFFNQKSKYHSPVDQRMVVSSLYLLLTE